MSADLNQPWWWIASGGAKGDIVGSSGAGGNNSDPLYDTVIRTNTTAYPSAQVAAAAAAAQAAAAAAAQGQASWAIEAAARAGGQAAWANITGSVTGYQGYEPGIFDQAASLLSPITRVATASEQTASAVLKSAGGIGLGALLGISGTTLLLVGAGIVALILIRK
jgi:hypothetical protein